MADTVTAPRDEVDDILDQLRKPRLDILDLLEKYQTRTYDPLWGKDPRLYRAFTKKLISAGHPARAIALARQGMTFERIPEGATPEAIRQGKTLRPFKNDPDLRYYLALAFARSGNPQQGKFHLDKLLGRTDLSRALKVEVLSLEGRYHKDRYQLASTPAEQEKEARLSADAYRKALEVSREEGRPGDYFPHINYATMSLLAGEPILAQGEAEKIIDLVAELRQRESAAGDYWLPATQAVAYFILSRGDRALAAVSEAIRLADQNLGDIVAMRRDMQLLRNAVIPDPLWEKVAKECDFGNVAVFAGHTLDHPLSYQGRFPSDPVLVGLVREAIGAALDKHNVTVGYCSASSGGDILFAEELLRHPRPELHVVMPFRREDFYGTSVDFGLREYAQWKMRCDGILGRARQIHYATTEPYLCDDILFNFLNTFLHGLALTRACERSVEAVAIVLQDPTLPPETFGTYDFVAKWRNTNQPIEIIDLAALRREASIPANPVRSTIAPPVPAPSRASREIKTMLFLDVKGYSSLDEEHIPPFFDRFLAEVREEIDRSPVRPRFTNTWGDGLFVVFDDEVDAADFAHRLLVGIRPEKWNLTPAGQEPAKSDEESTDPFALRIGLHTGPIYRYINKVRNSEDFFGNHVNRAARIEPVTTPGCAFASEQFAAALAIRRDHPFVCEFVGVENLAKGYDRCPLYRLTRR